MLLLTYSLARRFDVAQPKGSSLPFEAGFAFVSDPLTDEEIGR